MPPSMREAIELSKDPVGQLERRRMMKALMMRKSPEEVTLEEPEESYPTEDMEIEIGDSVRTYPGVALSTMCPYPFVIQGEACMSMEGFLQGLKFKDRTIQQRLFRGYGTGVRKAGAGKDWKTHQRVYFKGNPIDRNGADYQKLLNEAFDEMYRLNDVFKDALKATGKAVLYSSVMKTDPRKTLLTEDELCDRLEYLRDGETLTTEKYQEPGPAGFGDTEPYEAPEVKHETHVQEVFCKHQCHLYNQGITMCNAGYDPSKCDTCEFREPETMTVETSSTSTAS